MLCQFRAALQPFCLCIAPLPDAYSFFHSYSIGENLDSQGCVLLPSAKKKSWFRILRGRESKKETRR